MTAEDRAALAAIPMRLLQDRYLIAKAVRALAAGRCVDCAAALEVIDTWERACPTPGCGYTFNLYRWPRVGGPPETG